MKDVIVIGGGLMGSAAAWELAYAGENVLLLEQQGPVYQNGSSLGEARVTRSLGAENDVYSYLKETSVKETLKLIDFLNRKSSWHHMQEIHRTTPVTYLYDAEQRAEVDALVRDRHYVTAYSSEEADRLLDMTLENEIVVREFMEYSGTINPKVLIEKMQLGVTLAGGNIVYHQQVCELTREADGYRIEVRNTETNEYQTHSCRKLVVAAGPSTAELLQHVAPHWQQLLQTKRMYLGFFKPTRSAFLQLDDQQKRKFTDSFPAVKFDDQVFYSMVEKYDDEGLPLLKVGGHNRRFALGQDLWNDPIPESEIKWYREQLAAYLKRVRIPLLEEDLEFTDSYACVYTLTETEMPFVCNLHDKSGETDPNAVVIAGLSGIGAKGTLAYGLHAANLLLSRTSDDPMVQLANAAMGNERFRRACSQFNQDWFRSGS